MPAINIHDVLEIIIIRGSDVFFCAKIFKVSKSNKGPPHSLSIVVSYFNWKLKTFFCIFFARRAKKIVDLDTNQRWIPNFIHIFYCQPTVDLWPNSTKLYILHSILVCNQLRWIEMSCGRHSKVVAIGHTLFKT